MIEYAWARPEEENELLDFGNLVFSMAHAPTDFKKILPKVYDRPGFCRISRVARQDGRVIGMVASLPGHMQVRDKTLKYGYIGTVSTHPYHREKGIMKQLMPQVMEHMAQENYDFSVLSGQRQRYMHYGFEDAGSWLSLTFTKTSLRHTIGPVDASKYVFKPMDAWDESDVDFCYELYTKSDCFCHRRKEDFILTLKSWEGQAFVVSEGEKKLGYCALVQGGMTEQRFPDEAVLPFVISAYLNQKGLDSLTLSSDEALLARQPLLFTAADSWNITPRFMLHVFNWGKVLDAFLKLKAGQCTLEDGSAVMRIKDKGTYQIKVKDGVPSVSETDKEPDLVVDAFEAVRLVFLQVNEFTCVPTAFKNWFPLPLPFSVADGF